MAKKNVIGNIIFTLYDSPKDNRYALKSHVECTPLTSFTVLFTAEVYGPLITKKQSKYDFFFEKKIQPSKGYQLYYHYNYTNTTPSIQFNSWIQLKKILFCSCRGCGRARCTHLDFLRLTIIIIVS